MREKTVSKKWGVWIRHANGQGRWFQELARGRRVRLALATRREAEDVIELDCAGGSDVDGTTYEARRFL